MLNIEHDEIEAALFPIPNLVAFPGTVIPLHVFEPRYRQLVKDCLEDNRMIGVCHTQKTIRDAPQNQTAADMLQTNQATYQPQSVFSAGPCKLIDTTPDGRLLAEIHVQQRLAISSERQTLPYRIVNCQVIDDDVETNSAEADDLKLAIEQTLHEIIAKQDQKIADQFLQKEWTVAEFSFGVFQFLRFDPELMQEILEDRSALDRLKKIWTVIQQNN